MVVFPLVTLIMFETSGAQIFLVEFAGIVAFCAFWFVQSSEFFSGIARAWKEGGVSAVVRELR